MSGPYDQQQQQQYSGPYGGAPPFNHQQGPAPMINYGDPNQPPQSYGQPGYPPPQGYPPQGYPYSQQSSPLPQPGIAPQQYFSPSPQGPYSNVHSPYEGGQQGFGPPPDGGLQHNQALSPPLQYGQPSPQPGQYFGPPGEYQYGQLSPAPPGAFTPSSDGTYNQSPYPGPPHSPNSQLGPEGSVDPNAPPGQEGERGILGAIGGGVGGHFLGNKAGHGFLGMLGGAIAGSLVEDYGKKTSKKYNSQNQGQGHQGHHYKHGS